MFHFVVRFLHTFLIFCVFESIHALLQKQKRVDCSANLPKPSTPYRSHRIPKITEVSYGIHAKKDHQNIAQKKITDQYTSQYDATPFRQRRPRLFLLIISYPCPYIQRDSHHARHHYQGITAPCRYKIKMQKRCDSTCSTAKRTIEKHAMKETFTKQPAPP